MTTSGTQLTSCAEEEGCTFAGDWPTHPITWAGASQYHAFGRTDGRPAPFRWRRGCEFHHSQPRRHLNGARSPRMRPKSYFLCAPAQIIGWVGRSSATVRPSSSAHDFNCGRNAATGEFHCAQPRRVTKMVLDAPECAQRRGVVARSPTHSTTWVGAQREYAFWRTHGRPAPYGRPTLGSRGAVPSGKRR